MAAMPPDLLLPEDIVPEPELTTPELMKPVLSEPVCPDPDLPEPDFPEPDVPAPAVMEAVTAPDPDPGPPPLSAGLKQLGKVIRPPERPEDAELERVPNPHPDTLYLVRFVAPEFTSLCPVTAQPDFAHLVIDYVPGDWIVESRSLKLYLGSYRNHGAFHEDCTLAIAKAIVAAIGPAFLRIGGYWYPRGGIPIDVFWQTGPPPPGLWLPDQGVPPYRGRG